MSAAVGVCFGTGRAPLSQLYFWEPPWSEELWGSAVRFDEALQGSASKVACADLRSTTRGCQKCWDSAGKVIAPSRLLSAFPGVGDPFCIWPNTETCQLQSRVAVKALSGEPFH